MSHRRFPLTLLGVALGTTVLCSCRGPMGNTAGMKVGKDGEQAYVIADRSAITSEAANNRIAGNRILPRLGMKSNKTAEAESAAPAEIIPTAYDGPMPPVADGECPPMGPPGMEAGVPLPYAAYGPWSPPGLEQPWPKDEYLRDGGDRRVPTGVTRDWKVYGLEMEDAVAHYDTVDGRRIVEPSNEVYIYSPRFGAVRQVVGAVANEQAIASRGMTENLALEKPTHTQLVGSTKQNLQLDNRISARPAQAFRMKQGDGAISTAVGPRSFQDAFKPYENIAVIRMGAFESTEMMLLARSAQAAVAWNDNQAVQVILDKVGPMTAVQDEKLESVYQVDFEGHPALRLIKVASTPFAKPGEEVWFTLRFDNMGNQAIGNVTILDSLSTRLEYVEGSAQCSREGAFSTQANEGGSNVLRFELKDPLEAGDGGIIRFRCIVR
jgi:uncharacterized repeat protein (TIGR01451 family)